MICPICEKYGPETAERRAGDGSMDKPNRRAAGGGHLDKRRPVGAGGQAGGQERRGAEDAGRVGA